MAYGARAMQLKEKESTPKNRPGYKGGKKRQVAKQRGQILAFSPLMDGMQVGYGCKCIKAKPKWEYKIQLGSIQTQQAKEKIKAVFDSGEVFEKAKIKQGTAKAKGQTDSRIKANYENRRKINKKAIDKHYYHEVGINP